MSGSVFSDASNTGELRVQGNGAERALTSTLIRVWLVLATARLIGSPSQYTTVSGATMQSGPGSVSATLNSTVRSPPWHVNRSPLQSVR